MPTPIPHPIRMIRHRRDTAQASNMGSPRWLALPLSSATTHQVALEDVVGRLALACRASFLVACALVTRRVTICWLIGRPCWSRKPDVYAAQHDAIVAAIAADAHLCECRRFTGSAKSRQQQHGRRGRPRSLAKPGPVRPPDCRALRLGWRYHPAGACCMIQHGSTNGPIAALASAAAASTVMMPQPPGRALLPSSRLCRAPLES